MSSILKCPVKISVIIYIFIALLLLYYKPELMFDESGKSKGFGSSTQCEFFNFPVILYASAIVITFIFEYISIQIQ